MIKYKCLFCNKDYSKKLDEELKKKFKNTFKFSNSDVIKFILLFENFREMLLKIYELDLIKFISGPGLAQQAALKKTKVKLELLTDIDMLLMVEYIISNG